LSNRVWAIFAGAPGSVALCIDAPRDLLTLQWTGARPARAVRRESADRD